MSQRSFHYEHPEHGWLRIMAGWDPPLQYHFLTIGDPGNMLYSNLADPQGPGVPLERIAQILEQHNIPMPAQLLSDLELDRKHNLGTFSHFYEN